MANTEEFLLGSSQEKPICKAKKEALPVLAGGAKEQTTLTDWQQNVEPYSEDNVAEAEEDDLTKISSWQHIPERISEDNRLEDDDEEDNLEKLRYLTLDDIAAISVTETKLFDIEVEVLSAKSSTISNQIHSAAKMSLPFTTPFTPPEKLESPYLKTVIEPKAVVFAKTGSNYETDKTEEAGALVHISEPTDTYIQYPSYSASDSIIFPLEAIEEPTVDLVPQISKREERYVVSGWDDDNIEESPRDENDDKMGVLKAAETGNLKRLKQLVDADHTLVNFRDSDGYTALHCACYGNHIECVDYLLGKGANIAARTELLWQPLHSCCQWNHKNIAARLLQTGADVNALSEGGQTPLHIAAGHGASYETAQLLLFSPYLDPKLKNRSRETATDIARRNCKFYNIFEMTDPLIKGIDD